MDLVRPALGHLPSYQAALRRGWSPATLDPDVGWAELARSEADPGGFLASLDDREARGAPIVLPDGSVVARLPGFRRWMWEDGFVGSVTLRWQPGTPVLPPYVLGHVGYGVVPWARRRGHATAALRMLLPEACAVGLPYVELTTDVDNTASQHVIVAAGGVLVERFSTPPSQGSRDSLRWRIDLTGDRGD